MLRKGSITVALILSFFILTNVVFAGNIAAQAFGTRGVANVVGVKATIWTANQPSGWYAIGSPDGVCTTTPPCNGQFFETGYAKGTITSPPNVLQQYAAWMTSGGSTVNQFGLGNLSNNTWYTYMVVWNNATGRWDAYRNGYKVFQSPTGLGFTNGQMVACGAEGGDAGVPLGVECSNMQYKVGSIWTQYDYTGTQTWGIGYYYCVTRPYPYGLIAWGPC